MSEEMRSMDLEELTTALTEMGESLPGSTGASVPLTK